MQTNPKLALKVLNQTQMDFIAIEGSMIHIKDENVKLKLFKELQELKKSVMMLQEYYRKVLNGQK